MKNGESVPWLRNMILGHVEYTPAQLLPGKYLSLDCEMVGVGLEGKESSLARVSLVNYYGAVQLDEFVRQRERVVNYRTEFSGIRPSDMVKAKPFAEVQKQVADLLKDRILVGHAVFNDLKALLLTHPGTHTRDTQGYAGKHKVTSSRRPALRHLIQQEFGLAIQSGEHSSVTDARATMAVYRLHRKHWEKGNRPIASEPATPSAKSGKNKNKRKRVEREDGDGVSADEDPLLKVFPGGGRKGISSGLSVVVKRAGVKESKVAHGGRGDRRSVGVGGTKTQSEWWKDLGSSGSKGSIRL
ncbi:hypothetical protein JAAARDRAFT_132817 [Jaapia argillacea MUCL 33604]|uniref:RNA exonuclease 4 n=1 Tax=Jaapia argillacea MUCL 33604 TaxID=933084 RepID=A0A067PR79_9AGAM|nr:hypothetical protein JAAARDRAFT_132817 [Jaapia argillacea MUCL 33604]